MGSLGLDVRQMATPQQQVIERELILQLARRMMLSATTSCIGYGLQAFLLVGLVPARLLLAWVAGVAMFEVFNWHVARDLSRTVDDLRRRQRLLLKLQVGLAGTSCVWGAVVLLPGVSTQLEVLTIQGLGLALAGMYSVHNLSYHRGCLTVFSLGLALPLFWATLVLGFPAHLGAAGVGLVLVTQIYGWSTRNLMVNLIGTNIRNEQMTSELRRSHEDLTQVMQRLHQLATRDPLTHCLNRRALMDEMNRELARCQRHQSGFALIMIDLDHFKAINDRHGHGIGDAVLAATATRLSTKLRSTDSLGRWGGEEFLCLLTQTDPQAALQKAEALRQALAGQVVDLPGANFEVTASIGVAVYRPGQTLEEIIDAADQALYRAKRAGRNQVCS